MRLTPRDALMLGMGSLLPCLAALLTSWRLHRYIG